MKRYNSLNGKIRAIDDNHFILEKNYSNLNYLFNDEDFIIKNVNKIGFKVRNLQYIMTPKKYILKLYLEFLN